MRTVLMTAPGAEVAEDIVRSLVNERLIACGNVVPGVRSVYRWEGEVRTDPEALVVMKTVASRVPRLLERAVELHPYEVPEVLVAAVEEGFAPYLEWVRAECVPER